MTKDGGPCVDEADGPGDGDRPSSFEKELEGLINRHSQENGSNTPDFILAAYLSDCLATWNRWVKRRDGWYGVKLRPGMSGNGPDQDPVRAVLPEQNRTLREQGEVPIPYPHEATQENVANALIARGWTREGNEGPWARWAPPPGLRTKRGTVEFPVRLRVPTDETYDDYRLRMAEAVMALREVHGEPRDEQAEIRSLRARLQVVETFVGKLRWLRNNGRISPSVSARTAVEMEVADGLDQIDGTEQDARGYVRPKGSGYQ
jgi:hypothetical protein